MVFAPAGCFFVDDAKIVNLDDDIYINPAIPPGEVTTLTATIIGPTVTNPVIIISFNTPILPSSVSYGINISIGIDPTPPGTFLWPSEGTGAGEYDGKPDSPATEPTSVLTLDLRYYTPMFSTGDIIRLVLSPSISSNANTSVFLSNHGTFDFTL